MECLELLTSLVLYPPTVKGCCHSMQSLIFEGMTTYCVCAFRHGSNTVVLVISHACKTCPSPGVQICMDIVLNTKLHSTRFN